jgi:hypothetical protein
MVFMDLPDRPPSLTLTQQKDMAATWFAQLRDHLCASYETLEDEGDPSFGPAGQFCPTPWHRPGGGGGVMSVMKGGRVFEKVGVNISTVHGSFSPEFRANIPGAQETGDFWASGISLVAHPRSPHVPAVHFNTRFLVTSQTWFGGGGDMTPVFPKEEETQEVNTPNVSLNELLEKTRSQVGDKDFFSYSAKDNNCGNFIEFILKANGFAPTIALLEGSPNHTKIEKIYNFFKYRPDDVYTYANTLAEEWIVEPINKEQ